MAVGTLRATFTSGQTAGVAVLPLTGSPQADVLQMMVTRQVLVVRKD